MRDDSRQYLPKDSIFPFLGLRSLEPGTQVDPSGSPVFENLLCNKGIVTKRRGFVELGTWDEGHPNGTIMALVSFKAIDGTEHLVCLTTTKQYKYDSGTNAWGNITYQSAEVDVDWTGTEANPINYTVATGVDGSNNLVTWLVFTNGLDEPRYYDGSMSKTAPLSSATGWANTGFVTCKDLLTFYNRLVLVNVTRTGPVNWGTLIQWGAFQSLVDFENTDEGAGDILATDLGGSIQRIVPLGDRAVIYSDDSIGVLSYVGGAQIYTYETVIQDVRLLSARGIVNVSSFHLLMRKETISVFDGTRVLRDVGDPIYRDYVQDLSLDNHHLAFAFLDTPKNTIYFGVPLGSDQTVFYVLEYDTFDLSKLRWARHSFVERPTCLGFARKSASLTYNATRLSGVPYTGVNMSYRDSTGQKGFPARVIGLASGAVGLCDDLALLDGTDTIDGIYESPDFSVENGPVSIYARWLEIELDLQGTFVDVYTSIDGGSSWQLAQALSLNQSWNRERVLIDTFAKTLRIRLRSTGRFDLRWLRVWLTPREAI